MLSVIVFSLDTTVAARVIDDAARCAPRRATAAHERVGASDVLRVWEIPGGRANVRSRRRRRCRRDWGIAGTRGNRAGTGVAQGDHDLNLAEEAMANPTDESRCSGACRHRIEDDRAAHARIRSEYQEMPGLRLTLPQAARLFGLEPASCERMLNALVVDGELWKNGREFVRPRRF
jgi:hypothetical protein